MVFFDSQWRNKQRKADILTFCSLYTEFCRDTNNPSKHKTRQMLCIHRREIWHGVGDLRWRSYPTSAETLEALGLIAIPRTVQICQKKCLICMYNERKWRHSHTQTDRQPQQSHLPSTDDDASRHYTAAAMRSQPVVLDKKPSRCAAVRYAA